MISNEDIIRTSCGSEALEGLIVPDDVRDLARDCLEGSISCSDAVNMIIARYSETLDV